MNSEIKICKCGRIECVGFVLLHPKELGGVEALKQTLTVEHGESHFDMRISPSSGEIFTTFRELHVLPKSKQAIKGGEQSGRRETPEAGRGTAEGTEEKEGSKREKNS
jgi:hypothetical protein